jgi:SNF2 family DNA or RNA helicase
LSSLPPLWKHQVEIVNRAVSCGSFGIFADLGTGKTRSSIEILRSLYSESKGFLPTLIIGPSVVVENWKRELYKYAGLTDKFVVCLTGPGSKRINTFLTKVGIEHQHANSKKIVVCNYESLLMDQLFELLCDWSPQIIVFDESHRLKNIQAKRTKLAIKLADKAKHKFLLTGTPILQSLLDVFSQYRILDGGDTFGKNFYIFRNTYFTDKNAGMPGFKHWPDWKLKDTAIDSIKTKMFQKAMVVKKSECLDLPPLVKKIVYVDLSKEQQVHYESMKKNFITFINEKASIAELAITKALRLQQIVSGFIKTEDGSIIKLKTNPRAVALKELLSDIATDHKVIVWACWKDNYEQVRQVCEELNIKFTELTGETSQSLRQQAMDDFNKDPSVRVFLGNQGAAGIGVNLVSASYMIYYSRNFSLEQDLQSEARCYRGGSEIHEKITRIDLVAKDTIDEKIMEALANKQDISERVLSDIARSL